MAKNESHADKPCATCGTCPTCGNRPAARVYPYPVYPGTAPYPYYWGTWTVTNTDNTTVTSGSAMLQNTSGFVTTTN